MHYMWLCARCFPFKQIVDAYLIRTGRRRRLVLKGSVSCTGTKWPRCFSMEAKHQPVLKDDFLEMLWSGIKMALEIRPPPMRPGKKLLGRSCQGMRRCYKNILRSMPLKDSPRTEPVSSREDNLPKGRFFFYKKTQRFRPIQGCHTYKDQMFKMFRYSI